MNTRLRKSVFWCSALGFLGLTLACCSSNILRTNSGKGTSPLGKHDLLCDVQVVAVLANGTTIPKTVTVKNGVQIVIWAADADELTINFPVDASPFPRPMECSGRFCGMIVPPNVPKEGPHKFRYTGSVKTGSETHPLDPEVEIVF